MTMRPILKIQTVFCLIFILASCTWCTVSAQQFPKQVQSFLLENCNDCHEGSSAEAGFDITKLPRDFASTDEEKWIRVFDRIHEGEMPPADYGVIGNEKKKKITAALGSWLRSHEAAKFKDTGRVTGRRLTNIQLERTLHDLLGIDIPLAKRMPDEPRIGGFTTVARGQSMSHFHLENHLDVVDAALDEAFKRALSKDEAVWKKTLSAQEIARQNPKRRNREPEMLNGNAVTWNHNLVFYGRIPRTRATEDGWYRITVKAKGLKPSEGNSVWCSVRSGECFSSAPLLEWVGAFEAGSNFKDFTFEGWLPKDHMFEIRPADARLKPGRTKGGQVGAGEIGPQNVPGLAMKSIQLEKFHKGMSNDDMRKRLFGSLKLNLNKDPLRSRVRATDPKLDAAKLLKSFAYRAFRRPVDNDSLRHYFVIVNESLDRGDRFSDAIRAGYRAILCSPRFLYFNETPGQLDDFSIASRLSYFLWNRMPDYELFRAATAGKLKDKEFLRGQVDRMLAHEYGQNFVKDLAHDWLDLRLIDFTEPDKKLYPGFDLVVQNAMVGETEMYLQDMLTRNVGIGKLIGSNYTFLNSRLADYYELKQVNGGQLRKVELSAGDHRGGILTHGSILKVTANGTTTSPVLRGVWVSERLLGEEIPPPPENVSAIEPDIRGAKTIREQLEKHKSDPSCAACHVKMDPPGYALENFDPSGRWRNNYVKLQGRKRKPGQKVDPSSELKDGKKFADLSQFQKLILKQPRGIAKNVTEKLITYGTGAPIGFSDRPKVQQALDEAKKEQFGFRSIIKAVVTSDIFLTK